MTKLMAAAVLLLGLTLSGGAEAQRYGGGFRPSMPSYRPMYTPRPSYRPNTVPRATKPVAARPTYRPVPRPTYSGPGWSTYAVLMLWIASANSASAKPDTKLLGEIPCGDLIRKVREDGKITKDEGRLLREWSLVTGKRLDTCK